MLDIVDRRVVVRVRFAPSPTGPLHLGGLRTALYNYLFAKKHRGKFILRIEDTDRQRLVPNSESYILEALKWCKIEPDEGVGYGGPYFPYYQSKRLDIYRFYLNKLLDKDNAYYAFDTDKELNEKRKEYNNLGLNFSYNYSIRMNLNNSLSMNKQELKIKINSGIPYVIRFKIQPGKILKIYDLIRGNIEINTDELDDKILLKSNGYPTYHLASTIDDFLMKITHVIRGEEWLPSMPFHLLLYRAFGWNNPKFAHLPLILNNNGIGKISKRNMSLDCPIYPLQWKKDNTTTIKGYRELGFFPETIVNMLALLGWNPVGGVGKKEIFSKKELIHLFSLKQISKSGIVFNFKKLQWLNKQYLKKTKNIDNIIILFLQNELKKRSIQYNNRTYLLKIIHLVIDRLYFIHDIWEHTFYFFVDPYSYESDFLKKICNVPNLDLLEDLKKSLYNISLFNLENLKNIFDEKTKVKRKIMELLRFALVGKLKGVNLLIILEMLGQASCIRRINKLIKQIMEKI
ncbi:glutamate--tRNA ligase [Blattabacterium cuenoti]|uniref:glutamate--tRNA ligase n=1 Tax=Blattabacterium cuenoti TaxID=1653831 RepID=UPI001EEB96FC|nr:glutamate--tRNA ligase [Blattabacterium cuenoti]